MLLDDADGVLDEVAQRRFSDLLAHRAEGGTEKIALVAGRQPTRNVAKQYADLTALNCHTHLAEERLALDITVMKNGAVAYARAFGIADSNGRVAEPGQIYHFWSVTKLFTATAILQLVEDGKIVGANRSALDQLAMSGAAVRMHSLPSLLGTRLAR